MRSVTRLGLLVSAGALFLASAITEDSTGGIRVAGPGARPELGFACCDQGPAQMKALVSNPEVIADLKALHAAVAIPIQDFTPERAAAVRTLTQDGIPVIAWLMLSEKDGVYLNADNAPQAEQRVETLEQWTRENDLKWQAIGLDIEPRFDEFAALKGHRIHLLATLFENSLNERRAAHAREAYKALIHKIQSLGYPVQTYQMPYLPAERSVHSALLDRMLGTVDVRGNREYLMIYTSFARRVGAGMIWSLGRNAQGITVGVTDGETTPGSGSGPLDWNEFSRDLIVASHFTNHIGVYNLEGCVRQGFLPRLVAMDWSQTVVIPESQLSRARRMGFVSRTAIWVGSNLLYLLLLFFILIGWWWARRRRRTGVTHVGG